MKLNTNYGTTGELIDLGGGRYMDPNDPQGRILTLGGGNVLTYDPYVGTEDEGKGGNQQYQPTGAGWEQYNSGTAGYNQAHPEGIQNKGDWSDYAPLAMSAIFSAGAGGMFGGTGAGVGATEAGAQSFPVNMDGGPSSFSLGNDITASANGANPFAGQDFGWGSSNPFGGGGVNGSGLGVGFGSGAAAGAGTSGPMTLSSLWDGMTSNPLGTIGSAIGGLGVKDLLGAGASYLIGSRAADKQGDLAAQLLNRGDLQQQLAVQEAQKNRDFQASEANTARQFQTDFAAKYNPLTMSALNQPERKPYQDQFAQLTQNPGDFFKTDPMALAHQDMAQKAYEATGAKHGFGGTVFNDYLKNLTNETAQDYNIRSDQLMTAGGFKFGPGNMTLPGANNPSGSNTSIGAGDNSIGDATKLTMGSAPLNASSFEGFGNLFGGNPQGQPAGKGGLNFNNPFGSNTTFTG